MSKLCSKSLQLVHLLYTALPNYSIHSFAYVSNPAPDSSLCRAAAPRLHRSRFKLLFPFSSASACCPPIAPFNCCSPLAFASAALPRFQQLPDCVRFGCCSPIRLVSLKRSSLGSCYCIATFLQHMYVPV